MQLRRLLVIATLVGAAACADSAPPTDPVTAVEPDLQSGHSPPGCPSPAAIRIQIAALYVQPGQTGIAQLKFTAIHLAVLAGKPQIAQDLMYRLVAFTLQRYYQGDLKGGQSSATQTKLIALIKALYCYVGLPEPDLSSLSLGPDGAAAIVLPAGPDTVVKTQTQTAGVSIPEGSVTSPTLVTITRLPDGPPGPLNTPLDQYPAYYEFHSSSGVDFSLDVVVGTCQVDDFEPYSALKIGHNVGTGIELLPVAPAPFLVCPLPSSLRSPAGWLRYVQRNGWRGLGPLAEAMLLPRPLMAAAVGTCCLGGSTKKFSPFGTVDSRTSVAATSPTSIAGTSGQAVSSGQLPAVRVTTPLGNPVPGVTVTFSLGSGSSGSIGGTSQVTDSDGRASLGSWTLGTGPSIDTVTATVTPLQGTTVDGNPVEFSAAITAPIPVAYLSGSYSYKLIGSGSPPSYWYKPSYNASAWPVGAAAFGSGPGSPDNCPLDATVETSWPAAPSGGKSGLLLRRTFTVPAGFTGTLRVGVAIDNDVQVYVNGSNVTASAGSANLSYGFQKHEGCASRDSFIFTAPNSILVPGGSNLVAVFAKDRGSTSYVDLEVQLVP